MTTTIRTAAGMMMIDHDGDCNYHCLCCHSGIVLPLYSNNIVMPSYSSTEKELHCTIRVNSLCDCCII